MDYLIPQPRLKELRLENNFIISFRGFVTQPKLEAVWLEPNPICMHPNYRLMVAILQNNNYLVRVDDNLIDREDRLLARALGPYVADALRAGWLLDTELAVEADYDMTVEEFQAFQFPGPGDQHDTIVAGRGLEEGGDWSFDQSGVAPGSPDALHNSIEVEYGTSSAHYGASNDGEAQSHPPLSPIECFPPS